MTSPPNLTNPCPHCGQEHPPGMSFCPLTGKPLESPSPVCPNCGRQVQEAWVRCPQCSTPLKDVPPPDRRRLYWALGIIAVWVLAAGIIALILWRNNQQKPGTPLAMESTLAASVLSTRTPTEPGEGLESSAGSQIATSTSQPTTAPSASPSPLPSLTPSATQTPVPSLTNTLIPSLTLVPTLEEPDEGPWQPCPDTYPSRLHVDDRAYVSYDPPLPNRVRSEPSTSAEVLGKIEPGQVVIIKSGPACAENWVWWLVRAVDSSLRGWTSEGDQDNYWLVPKD